MEQNGWQNQEKVGQKTARILHWGVLQDINTKHKSFWYAAPQRHQCSLEVEGYIRSNENQSVRLVVPIRKSKLLRLDLEHWILSND